MEIASINQESSKKIRLLIRWVHEYRGMKCNSTVLFLSLVFLLHLCFLELVCCVTDLATIVWARSLQPFYHWLFRVPRQMTRDCLRVTFYCVKYICKDDQSSFCCALYEKDFNKVLLKEFGKLGICLKKWQPVFSLNEVELTDFDVRGMGQESKPPCIVTDQNSR